jgi:UDP-3-O-[3-hydroxymyristoyl] glucosamine N-acyltransferase
MGISLASISELIRGEVIGDADKIINGVAPFEEATSEDITYAGAAKFLKKINDCNAGAIIVPKDFHTLDRDIIKVENPRVAFAYVVNHFHPKTEPQSGQSKRACVGKNFSYGKNYSIGPFVVIGDNVIIGNNVKIHPHVYIGDNVCIGDDVEIYPNATILERCRIGSRVIIHSGTVIGSDGFGFAPDGVHYCKVPQIGIVQIDDDVEIGAGNMIDRATFGKTWIQNGVKTDNLVHIAHNVTIGENTLLVAQVGIAGSVTVGRQTVLAGQAGVIDHLTIGDNVTIGPQAGIVKSIQSGETVSGFVPAMPHKLFLKVQNILLKLPELKKKIDAIEKKIEKMIGNKS